MGKEIKLLDCTLRDGGYVNDWNFGNGNMTCIFDRLNRAGVDIIEIGFLDDRQPSNINRSIQPDTQSLSKAYSKTGSGSAMVVAMIDYGTCSLEHIQEKTQTCIDGIRVIFKKENMHRAIDFGLDIMKKGYKLFLQMVSITSYSDEDVVEFTEHVNKIEPYAVSIVDTYGLMHEEQMFHYFNLLDKNLNKNIGIGYHSHNNFQLAYSNTLEMIKLESERMKIVDGTLYGMGKSAGNAPLELLAMYLNKNEKKEYDIDQILEAIDANIMPIYAEHYWGYSLQFYIAAENDCHPNYVKYLLEKKTLSVKDINTILSEIELDFKLKFNKKIIENLYLKYLIDSVNDVCYVDSLARELEGKNLLIIGPGKSIVDSREKVSRFIKECNPITIAVNFIPDGLKTDFIFISNSKRYPLTLTALGNTSAKTIATSNITPINTPFDYTIRFDSLITDSDEIWDNALVILLNLLLKIGVHSVSLAGFDGFTDNMTKNYADSNYILHRDYSYLNTVNERLRDKIKEYRDKMNITFITPSLYDGCEMN